MAYRSQLVIRTKEPKGARIIERVKELAELEDKTFSDKAIELLGRGLGGLLDSDSDEGEEDEENADESDPAEQRSESAVRRDPVPALAPPEIDEKSPDIRPDESPRDAAKRGAQLFVEQGPESAAQALTRFFAAAEPVDGASIREELQDRMTKSDYDVLMEELKKTDEYRAYRKRVVYASW